MTDWEILLTEQAEDDLRCVYEYIAVTLLAPATAKNLVRQIVSRIAKISGKPKSYTFYPKEPWRSRGLRRVNEGNYAIFFLPVEKQHIVAVIRIMYSGRNIEKILDGISDQFKL